MWTRVDDRLHSNAKMLACTASARSLWLMALSWTGDSLTDGFIPHKMLGRLLGQKRDALKLVEVGLWEHAEKDGIPGYQFVNFEKWNKPATRAEVEKRRNRNAARVAKHRNKTETETVATPLLVANPELTYPTQQGNLGNSGQAAPQEWEASGDVSIKPEATHPTPPNVTHYRSITADFSPSGQAVLHEWRASGEPVETQQLVSGDVSIKPEATHPTPPNVTHYKTVTLDPTRPDPLRGVTVAKNRNGKHVPQPRHEIDAPSVDKPPTAPEDARCPNHAHIRKGEYVPACRACQQQRQQLEQAWKDWKTHQARKRKEDIAQCPWCETEGWRIDPTTGLTLTPAIKCNHQPLRE